MVIWQVATMAYDFWNINVVIISRLIALRNTPARTATKSSAARWPLPNTSKSVTAIGPSSSAPFAEKAS